MFTLVTDEAVIMAIRIKLTKLETEKQLEETIRGSYSVVVTLSILILDYLTVLWVQLQKQKSTVEFLLTLMGKILKCRLRIL